MEYIQNLRVQVHGELTVSAMDNIRMLKGKVQGQRTRYDNRGPHKGAKFNVHLPGCHCDDGSQVLLPPLYKPQYCKTRTAESKGRCDPSTSPQTCVRGRPDDSILSVLQHDALSLVR
ncbi:hypothetical protein INR49_008261 [Caranx melampygus]|nr:hypothetical protein INR49_008261 [Caranx melampygus]